MHNYTIFEETLGKCDKGPSTAKTCVKRQLKNRQNKDLNDKW